MENIFKYRLQENRSTTVGNARCDVPLPQLLAGHSYVFQFHFLEQVSDLTGFDALFDGMGEFYFRVSQSDNPTEADFGPWNVLNDSNLRAVSLDPNKPTFIECKVTAITNGFFRFVSFVFNYDATASKKGPIWNEFNIYKALPQVVESIVMEFAPKRQYGINGTQPAFSFHYGSPEKCVNDNIRAAVYFEKPSYTESPLTLEQWNKQVEFTIGLRRLDNIEQRGNWEEMQGLIKSRFGYVNDQHFYSVVVDGVKYIGNLPQLGIRNCATLGDTQRTPPSEYADCGNTWWETIVQFDLTFKNIAISYG